MVIFADKILNIYVYKNLEESEIVQWPFLGEGIVFDQLKEPTRVWTADRHADQPIVVPFKKFASKIGKVTTPNQCTITTTMVLY